MNCLTTLPKKPYIAATQPRLGRVFQLYFSIIFFSSSLTTLEMKLFHNHFFQCCFLQCCAVVQILFAATLFITTLSAQTLEKAPHTASSADSLRKLLPTLANNTLERMNLLNALAKAYRYSSTDSSLLYANEAHSIATRLGDRRGMAWAGYHQSYALYGQGKYDLVLEKLTDILPEFERIQDTSGIAYTVNELGNIYKRQNRFPEAIEYFKQALAGFRAVGDDEGTVLVLANIGATERMAGNHRASFDHSFQALALGERIGYDYGIVFASANIGACYAHWRQYDSALTFYERALTIATRIHNEKYTGQLHYFIGAVYAKQGKFQEAERYIGEGLHIAEEGHFAERVKEAYTAFVEMYRLKGDYKQALEYHERYSRLQDSLFSADVRKNIDGLQTRLATEKKDKEILLLQKEQQLSSLVRNSLIAGLVLAGVVLWLFVNRYQLKRDSERELRSTNDKLLSTNSALGQANAHLSDANAEITRQMGLLEEQARMIEIANSELQELSIRQEMQNLQLKDLNEEKNEFLGIAAHDLKNPLSGIQNIAEVLLMDDHLPLDSRREMLMHVVKSSERMFELIKNLLDVNAIERGGFHPHLQPTNIRQIATLTADHYSSRAAQKDITLSFEAETEAFVLADAGALEQIIDNLISNAVKYSPHGNNIFVRLKNHSSDDISTNPSTTSDQYVRFEVQDEGPGLSETDKIKLFGKFARLSAQPTGGEHSTGLGLSIVKKMVEAMNGKVWCESELGNGATFIVELPKAA